MLCACFSVSQPNAESIGLPRTSALASNFTETSSSPPIYRKTLSDPGITPPLYFTTIKTCGYAKDTSTPAITRQLFVGMEKLTAERQENVPVANRNARLTIMQGVMEDVPLRLAAYTLRGGECVVDYVLWMKNPENNSAVAAIFEREVGGFKPVIEETLGSLGVP